MAEKNKKQASMLLIGQLNEEKRSVTLSLESWPDWGHHIQYIWDRFLGKRIPQKGEFPSANWILIQSEVSNFLTLSDLLEPKTRSSLETCATALLAPHQHYEQEKHGSPTQLQGRSPSNHHRGDACNDLTLIYPSEPKTRLDPEPFASSLLTPDQRDWYARRLTLELWAPRN